MNWIQRIDPLGNIALSALVAAIPVLFIFLLLIRKVKGYIASLLTVVLAIVIAMAVYGMPLNTRFVIRITWRVVWVISYLLDHYRRRFPFQCHR